MQGPKQSGAVHQTKHLNYLEDNQKTVPSSGALFLEFQTHQEAGV